MPYNQRIAKLKRYHHNVPRIPKLMTGLTPMYVRPANRIESGKSITIMYSRLWVSQIARHPPR
jgi:hypothetical protein